MKIYLLMFFLSASSLITHAQDTLKMKNGSTLRGEIVGFNKEGIVFKMENISKNVELKWESLSDETAQKYKDKIPAQNEVAVAEEPEANEKEGQVEPKEKNPLADKNIAKKLFDRYKVHLKKIVQEYASGNFLASEKGVLLKLKDNKTVRGKFKSEKKGIIELVYNGQPLQVNRDDVLATEDVVYSVSKGHLSFSNLKDANKQLHESCLALASYDIGIETGQGLYIWGLRGTGGKIQTSDGEHAFNEYKKTTYVDLGTMGHIFFGAKGTANKDALPSEDEWNAMNLNDKIKYFEALNAINIGINLEPISRQCSMCRGEGKVVTKKEDAVKGNSGGKKVGSKEGQGSKTEHAKCSQCQGVKNLYTIKFQ